MSALIDVMPSQESRCKTCDEPIAWVFTGRKSGRKYPTNVLVDSTSHSLVTSKMWFHKCVLINSKAGE